MRNETQVKIIQDVDALPDQWFGQETLNPNEITSVGVSELEARNKVDENIWVVKLKQESPRSVMLTWARRQN